MNADRKDIVNQYLNMLKEGKYKESVRFFATDCVTHNPYIKGSMDTLTDAMIAASADMSKTSSHPDFSVKYLLGEGDIVIAHTELLFTKSRPGDGGLRQAHVFRFEGDKIAEYWDITQQVLPDMPNAAGAF